jgi:hypothetical protein
MRVARLFTPPWVRGAPSMGRGAWFTASALRVEPQLQGFAAAAYRSTIMAMPMPPPMHMVTMPVL